MCIYSYISKLLYIHSCLYTYIHIYIYTLIQYIFLKMVDLFLGGLSWKPGPAGSHCKAGSPEKNEKIWSSFYFSGTPTTIW